MIEDRGHRDTCRQSVATVTVAYNGAELLRLQIAALLRQTRPIQEIVIVDNQSKDSTVQILAKEFPNVTILHMKENLGQAGGWAAGLAYAALEKKHDWIWSFDQDSVPELDALELLLSGYEQIPSGQRIGMLAPIPFHGEPRADYLPMLWRNGFVKVGRDDMSKQPTWYADLVIASGCLVSSEVVQRVGVPRADFFMDFCDFEYCLRVRSQGYKIAVITKCLLSHKIGNAQHIRLLGYDWAWPDYPAWREYYLARNITYAAWWLYPKARIFAMGHLLRHACAVLMFSKNKRASLRRLSQGLKDGKAGRMGIRFLPGSIS